MDRVGRRLIQLQGFGCMALAFAALVQKKPNRFKLEESPGLINSWDSSQDNRYILGSLDCPYTRDNPNVGERQFEWLLQGEPQWQGGSVGPHACTSLEAQRHTANIPVAVAASASSPPLQ